MILRTREVPHIVVYWANVIESFVRPFHRVYLSVPAIRIRAYVWLLRLLTLLTILNLVARVFAAILPALRRVELQVRVPRDRGEQ